MPEGPEIRLNVDLIRPLVQNKKLVKACVYPNSRYRCEQNVEGLADFLQDLETKLVWDVKCKGKFIFWVFGKDEFLSNQDNYTWYLYNTFGMSGQYSTTKGKHPCFSLHFEDGTDIYFNDPRHFGTIKFVKGYSKQLSQKLNTFGWDPLQDKLDDYWLFIIKSLDRTAKPIAQILMDQSIFSGVGNYIKCESLYLSKISPWFPCNQLSQKEIKTLCQAIVEVMETSYQHQGATIQTYKTPYGEEGKYSSCFKVYGKKLDPDGNEVIRETTPDKRTTHWVPKVQR